MEKKLLISNSTTRYNVGGLGQNGHLNPVHFSYETAPQTSLHWSVARPGNMPERGCFLATLLAPPNCFGFPPHIHTPPANSLV